MGRKCVSFAFALLLLATLGVAIAHSPAYSLADTAIRFSAPCEPASPSFQAAERSKAALKIDWSFDAEASEAPAGIVQSALFGTAARPIPLAAPRTFPPLLHRPPPANS